MSALKSKSLVSGDICPIVIPFSLYISPPPAPPAAIGAAGATDGAGAMGVIPAPRDLLIAPDSDSMPAVKVFTTDFPLFVRSENGPSFASEKGNFARAFANSFPIASAIIPGTDFTPSTMP